MKLSLPAGNSKMGNVLHVNLPPNKICMGKPCYIKGCYAHKAYRTYPNVRKAWDENWKLLMTDRDRFFIEIIDAIKKKKPEIFRWHSAGDIPDSSYLRRMFAIAHTFPGTKFMAFTKQYDIVDTTINRRSSFWRPENMTIIVSAWPRLELPMRLRRRFPVAWMHDPLDPDTRIPKKATPCSGKCSSCLLCWGLRKGQSVVFEKH